MPQVSPVGQTFISFYFMIHKSMISNYYRFTYTLNIQSDKALMFKINPKPIYFYHAWCNPRGVWQKNRPDYWQKPLLQTKAWV